LMILTVSAVSVAVVLMATGFEGYLYGVGPVSWPIRIFLFIGAAGFLYPSVTGYAIAAAGTVIVYGVVFMLAKRRAVAAG
ncbi:MAG: hypothetical protein OSB69_17765, partial [Alphaproteobacteria bacterium]|nr:hypothetical protein [Alphaproteobacteria bacterium]